MAKDLEKKGTDLEDNRIIYVNGEFNEAMAKDIFESLIKFETSDATKDVLIIIDSFGGQVYSFLAIYDYIQLMRCNVATLAVGKAMSCGQLLLMSGTKGKRFATKNARILMHELSMGTWGKLTDVEIDVNEGKALRKIMEKLIKKHTDLSKTEVKKFMERDSFMSAKELKKCGAIDHVVTSHKDLYRHLNL